MSSNVIQWAPRKPLKSGFCGFCYFVRGRGRNTLPHTRTDAEGNTPSQNNKINRIIYINRLEGHCVTSGGIV